MFAVLGPLLNHNVAAMAGGGGAAFSPTTLPGIMFDLENIPASVLNAGTTAATDLQHAYKWNSQVGGLNLNDAGNGTGFQPIWHANSGANGWLHSANAELQSTTTFAGTDASGSFYLAAMVNFDALGSTEPALTLTVVGAPTTLGQLRILSAGATQAVVSDSGATLRAANGGSVTGATWHTLIMSVDGTAGTIDVWLDGVVGTQFTGLSPTVATSNCELFLPDGNFSNAVSHKGAIHGTGTISSGNVASLHTYLAAL